MKKIVLFLIPVLLMILLPVNTSGGSFYNGISGSLFCNSSDGCLHEISHRMDDDLGYPSRSPAFGNAIMIHLAFSLKYEMDDTALAILAQEGLITYSPLFSMAGMERFSSPQEELYANIFALSGGDVSAIPPAFRDFYSTDDMYMDLYDCLMTSRVKVCGTSLHVEKNE